MKVASKLTILFIVLCLIGIRLHYSKTDTIPAINVLTWDAFGYYLLLPAKFIYHDYKKMEWVEGIVAKYQTTGNLYQLHPLGNGNRVMKYFMGISILYAPFFLLAHVMAGWLSFPQDGFSAPYQFGIFIAFLVYVFLGLWVLRKVLLKFFEDKVVALILVLITLGTNYVQYVAVDSAQTHGYIFALYAFLLWTTVVWHEHADGMKAFVIGLLIGLGILCRPTEAVMLLIPVLYGMHNTESRKAKRKLVCENKKHILIAFLGGCLALFPQFLYWKFVTGQWIYDVGAKFEFFKPHWQVLFGWEKGWFVYTPLVLLMVVGLFFLKKNPFYLSILIFFILNTWIVIAWSDWHYGATYSSRALVQGYAVLAIPMGMSLEKLLSRKQKLFVILLLAFFVLLNLFQVWQYNKGILHYRDMNRKYYQAIFLNPSPSPVQLSLLDTDEFIRDDKKFEQRVILHADSVFIMNVAKIPERNMVQTNMDDLQLDSEKENWFKVSADVKSGWGAFDSYIIMRIENGAHHKETKCRLQNGMSKPGSWNKVEFYYSIPEHLAKGKLIVKGITASDQDIFLANLTITSLSK